MKSKTCPSCGAMIKYRGRPPSLCPVCTKEKKKERCRRRHKETYTPKRPNEASCATCGSTFNPTHGHQKYCSQECSDVAQRRDKKVGTKACTRCGDLFTPRGRQKACDKCLPELRLERSHGKLLCCVKHRTEFRSTSESPTCPQCKEEDAAHQRLKKREEREAARKASALKRIQKDKYHNFTKKKNSDRMRNRGLEFDLSFDDWVAIKGRPCAYCGVTHCYVGVDKETGLKWHYNTIDRVDPSRGYVKDNCVPCCHACNSAKGEFTLKEFEDHIEKILSHLKNRAQQSQ